MGLPLAPNQLTSDLFTLNPLALNLIVPNPLALNPFAPDSLAMSERFAGKVRQV